jgi:hypothetical protein
VAKVDILEFNIRRKEVKTTEAQRAQRNTEGK